MLWVCTLGCATGITEHGQILTQVAGAFGLAVGVSSALWAVQGPLYVADNRAPRRSMTTYDGTVAAFGMPLYDHLRRR